MTIQTKFQETGENVIASYDWTDLAEGVGYKTFYGLFKLSGSTGILASSNSLYSGTFDGFETAVVGLGTGAMIKIITRDFATTFNMPKIIKGDIIVNAGHRLALAGTSGGSVSVYDDITIFKNGTSIKQLSGAVVTKDTGTGLATSGMSLVVLNLPQTHFKKDDELKVRIDTYGAKTGSQVATTSLGHDPIGRDPDSAYSRATTKLSIHIPFIIDL